MGAIVFRDELYDVRSGDGWLQDAPIYGVPFGAKHVSIFVELPHDYLVWPEAYRQFLRFRGNDQRQVHVSEFSALGPELHAGLARGDHPQLRSGPGEPP